MLRLFFLPLHAAALTVLLWQRVGLEKKAALAGDMAQWVADGQLDRLDLQEQRRLHENYDGRALTARYGGPIPYWVDLLRREQEEREAEISAYFLDP